MRKTLLGSSDVDSENATPKRASIKATAARPQKGFARPPWEHLLIVGQV